MLSSANRGAFSSADAKRLRFEGEISMWNINFPIEGVKYHSDEISALYLKQNAWHEGTAGELLRTTARRIHIQSR